MDRECCFLLNFQISRATLPTYLHNMHTVSQSYFIHIRQTIVLLWLVRSFCPMLKMVLFGKKSINLLKILSDQWTSSNNDIRAFIKKNITHTQKRLFWRKWGWNSLGTFRFRLNNKFIFLGYVNRPTNTFSLLYSPCSPFILENNV